MKKTITIIIVGLLSIFSFLIGCEDVSKEITPLSIVSFDVEPNTINQTETSTISWVVTGATSVSINNGIGIVTLSGNRILQPTQTTTYILTAENATMTKSASTKITVKSVSNESNESHENPEIIISSFEVNPDEINLGESAYLTWVVTGATSVNINNGIGYVALTGNRMIQPTKTTTYTLTASNAIVNKQATVVIYVQSEQNPPPSTPNIACTTDSTTNKVTVATADAGIKWDDITITTNPVVNWALFTGGGIVNQTTNAYPNNPTVTVIAGDYLHLYGVSVGNVQVTFRYVPTNSLLGTWTVNV